MEKKLMWRLWQWILKKGTIVGSSPLNRTGTQAAEKGHKQLIELKKKYGYKLQKADREK